MSAPFILMFGTTGIQSASATEQTAPRSQPTLSLEVADSPRLDLSCLTLNSDCFREHVGFHYYKFHHQQAFTGTSQVGLSLEISNRHPTRTLREVELFCRIIHNNAVELYSGRISARPNLLSNARSWFRSDFVELEHPRINNPFNPTPPEKRYYRWQNAEVHNAANLELSCSQATARF